MTRRIVIVSSALLLAATLIIGSMWGALQSEDVSVSEAARILAASDAVWNGSITLVNPTTSILNGNVAFYAEGSSTVAASKTFTLPAHGATSFSTQDASLGLPSPFNGAGVVSADQQILAQYVFWSSTSGMDRAVYNGFSSSEASTSLYLPMFSYQYSNQNSTLALQNTEGAAALVTLEFYNTSGVLSASVVGASIPANSVKYFKAGSITFTSGSLSAGWSGSVLVTCNKRLVGAIFQPYTVGGKVVSYEGVAAGATRVYIPSILRKFGGIQQTSYVAIQNTTASVVTATLSIYNQSGALAVTPSPQIVIPAKSKQVFNPILQAGLTDGFSGSAVINATGAVAAIVNVGSNTSNFAIAYSGLTAGSSNVGLSYVRWNYQTPAWKSWLAIQNVGAGPVNVTIKYYDANGVLLGSKSITGLAQYAKANSNPGDAVGVGGTVGIGGSAIIEATGGSVVVLNNSLTVDNQNAMGATGVPFTP
jgi:hypothetical protein